MKRATAAWRSGTRLHLRGGRVAAYGSTTNRAYATDTSKVRQYLSFFYIILICID